MSFQALQNPIVAHLIANTNAISFQIKYLEGVWAVLKVGLFECRLPASIGYLPGNSSHYLQLAGPYHVEKFLWDLSLRKNEMFCTEIFDTKIMLAAMWYFRL